MRFLGFKSRIIGWLMLYVSIGFLPMAFPGKIIYPFFLTPGSGIEKFNYASGIVLCSQHIILLLLLFQVLLYFQRINADSRLNNWIKKSTQDILRITFAILIYKVKELGDYLFFENVVPDCLDPFWFLIIWEIAPVILLMAWAVISAKRTEQCHRQEE